jgi:predicted enzyme related to lactoylglutathione lyase
MNDRGNAPKRSNQAMQRTAGHAAFSFSMMFSVDDIDAVVAHMRAHGAELIGEMQYEDTYRLAYIRGPEGIIVALAEQLGQGVSGV